MIPHAAPLAPPPAWMLKPIPPELRPYLRRVAMLIVLAAAAGAALALLVPAGHH
jgi:hypothetical protein